MDAPVVPHGSIGFRWGEQGKWSIEPKNAADGSDVTLTLTLAPGGRLVSIGGAFGAIPDTPPNLTEGRKATRFSITNYLKAKPDDFKQLDEILRLVQQKKFRVPIDKSFPLSETRAAQRHLQGREHFGKVILTM